MGKQVYEFTDYKAYLLHALDTSETARGMRTRMAQALGCQTAFVSQVLNGHTHFSLEHAARIRTFLALSKDEGDFFMLLVHLGRAGTRDLAEYYRDQLEGIIRRRQTISERIQVKRALSKEDQAQYYSSWIYATIHVMLSIPRFKTAAALSEHLALPLNHVTEVLEFLASVGLARRIGGRFEIGTTRIHLGQDSPLISKHHTNWRMRAIHALDVPQKGDLHYSSVVTLSEDDAKKIREILLASLEKVEPILVESKEEAAFALSLDLYRI